MIKIKFNRDSVCLDDDINSHETSFDVDEKMTIDDFIGLLYSKSNIARIAGGEATWILQLRSIYNSSEFYAKYLGQKDPEVVYNNLKQLRLGY